MIFAFCLCWPSKGELAYKNQKERGAQGPCLESNYEC